MLVLRILTILFASAGISFGGLIIVAGLLEQPKDTGAIWLGAGIFLYYAANLFLLYKSYKKNHKPTHWVALILGALPMLIIIGIVILTDKFMD